MAIRNGLNLLFFYKGSFKEHYLIVAERLTCRHLFPMEVTFKKNGLEKK